MFRVQDAELPTFIGDRADGGLDIHVDLSSAHDALSPLALSAKVAEATALALMVDGADSRGRTRDAASLAGINRRNSRFWAGDNEPEGELREEQEAALSGNRAGGAEIWDATGEEFEGEAASDTFDASQYGVERMADGKFRVRKRRDRRAADAGTVLDWGSSTQQQIGVLRQLNAFYRRHWETKR